MPNKNISTKTILVGKFYLILMVAELVTLVLLSQKMMIKTDT